jgi:hypothetical protein
MRTRYTLLLFWFIFISMVASIQVSAATSGQKKSIPNNPERQREYQEAVKALKDQIFLISFYSFVDKGGNVAGIEPEGNFINISKDKFMMQKSASLILNTFAGSDHIAGQFSDFKVKENHNGNVQFSFVIAEGEKVITFKGKMNKGNNMIEGSLKGMKEDREIFVSGNVQPVKSHFEY